MHFAFWITKATNKHSEYVIYTLPVLLISAVDGDKRSVSCPGCFNHLISFITLFMDTHQK
jgi:hypothetical protein